MLLLVLSIVIVLLAVSGTPGGVRGLWDRVTGAAESNPTEQQIPAQRRALDAQPMNAQDGMRQVDRMQRDMARMDSLAGSVRDR